MPAWTPGADEFSPFDEEGELKEDIPQDLAKFLDEHSVTQNFTIKINLYKNENFTGFPRTCGTCSGTVPNYDGLVSHYGPGYYMLQTSWTPKGGKSRTENFKVGLVGTHYQRLFDKADEVRKAEDLKEAEHKADLDAIKRGKGLMPAGNGLGDFLENYRKMQEASGGGNGKGGNDLGLMMGMMGQMFQGMFQMQVAQMQSQTQMMVALIGGKDKNSDMQYLTGIFEKMIGLNNALNPRDKSWIEEVVTALADNVESIVTLFQKPKEEREADENFRDIDKGLNKTRERAQADPAFLRALVTHLDKKVGSTMSDKILSGFMKVKRPGMAKSEEAVDAEVKSAPPVTAPVPTT